MSNLTKRILFAVPAAVLVVGLTWEGGWFFNGLILFVAAAVQHEIVQMGTQAGAAPNKIFVYLIGTLVLLHPWIPAPALWGIGLLLIFTVVELFNEHERKIQSLTSTFFFGVYAPLGLVLLMLIRDTGSSLQGFLITCSIFMMVWGNDVFAYFGGKALGRHKLVPSVSPNKTWEGFIIGFLGAFAGLAIVMYALPFEFPLTIAEAWPMAVLTSMFGPAGDITESKLKRAANLKDSSSILPGHGGFFDRFDAMILVSPAIYVYLQWLIRFGYASF